MSKLLTHLLTLLTFLGLTVVAIASDNPQKHFVEKTNITGIVDAQLVPFAPEDLFSSLLDVTGWLLCVSMLNADCLMQYHRIVSVIQRRRDM